MKSPFPGMDPYLEMHWLDVHHRLCSGACDAVQAQLGGQLVARIGERLVVEEVPGERGRTIVPDLHVSQSPRESGSVAVLEMPLTVAEPVVIVADEDVRQPFIEIKDARSGKVVTVIGFLSPTNKLSGEGRKKYREKRRELRRARVSLVEVDLTRAGRRRFVPPGTYIPIAAQGTYQACVTRGYRPGKYALYGFPLNARLPAIRIPLRRTDKDVYLDLQGIVNQAYEKGRYDLIDYSKPCEPPLDGDEAAWAERWVKPADKQA